LRAVSTAARREDFIFAGASPSLQIQREPRSEIRSELAKTLAAL
jgi:hypothetical protein